MLPRPILVSTLVAAIAALSAGTTGIDLATRDAMSAGLARSMSTGSTDVGRDQLLADGAPVRTDPRYTVLKAQFETAASVADHAQRREGFRAVVTAAEPLRPRVRVRTDLPVEGSDVATGTTLSPAALTRLTEFLGANIHPSEFDTPQGSKGDHCGDTSDRFWFPNGDPAVDAGSTPEPGDSDCDMVSAAKLGGTFVLPQGTKSVELSTALDYTLNADGYAVGGYARSEVELGVVFVPQGFKLKGGDSSGNDSGLFVTCTLRRLITIASIVEVDERQAVEVNKVHNCTIAPKVAGTGGTVMMAYFVRASVDADLLGAADADGVLTRIRNTRLAFKR
jgi:hypothetical protein